MARAEQHGNSTWGDTTAGEAGGKGSAGCGDAALNATQGPVQLSSSGFVGVALTEAEEDG
jgi:hypothetical protein